ncbi:MAG: PQQ-binding-like beta-propeller repeat protein [Acidimicrobiales bacterium]|nr:PQQ-binding-like beta-propeller repeat protein [Acidimicrobiales bacterium]
MNDGPQSVSPRRLAVLVGLLIAAVIVAALALRLDANGSSDTAAPTSIFEAGPTTSSPPAGQETQTIESSTTSTEAATTTSTTTSTTTTSTTFPFDGWVHPQAVGVPWSDTVDGLLTFRGSPTRTFYGKGPVPTNPQVLWSFPDSGSMCSESTSGGQTRTWCGTGWTGQPSVWEVDDETWMAFGAYDRAIHVLNADSGEPEFDAFTTGDIIKGSVTIDPDGFPLIYSGSRDNYFRVLAWDRPGGELVELWRLAANDVGPTKWNNDWDGAALIIDDYLFEGGENSRFHIVKLNRTLGPDGLVQVDPEIVFHAAGWDDELVRAVGNNVSIENSVAISGNVVYFANSGGLVQGWDIEGLAEGVEPERVFRFWTGDDVDASIVIDDEGFLYVGAEYERGLARAREVGQIIKLDPSKPDDPIVWSIDDSARLDGGVWATSALYRDIVIAATDGGRVLGIDRQNGEIVWTLNLVGPLWQSPVVVDDVLIQGDCNGVLHAFDVSDTRATPTELWRVDIGGCIESTPAVWDGTIYVGTRGGKVHAIGDHRPN